MKNKQIKFWIGVVMMSCLPIGTFILGVVKAGWVITGLVFAGVTLGVLFIRLAIYLMFEE
jgi:hypothetical protein